jgi:hypothetical protein
MIHMAKGARGHAYHWKPEESKKERRYRMIETAIKRGKSTNGNHAVYVTGERADEQTFLGPHRMLAGTIICTYYNTKIVGVDFVNQRITNYGYDGYSVSTSGNISSWESFIRMMFPFQMKNAYVHHSWLGGHKPRYTSEALEELYDDFKTRAPWIEKDKWNGVEWFLWSRYDQKIAEVFWDSAGFLQHDQNWRYFTYAWDDNGVWSRRFISPETEKRWRAREAKRTREKNGHLQAVV